MILSAVIVRISRYEKTFLKIVLWLSVIPYANPSVQERSKTDNVPNMEDILCAAPCTLKALCKYLHIVSEEPRTLTLRALKLWLLPHY